MPLYRQGALEVVCRRKCLLNGNHALLRIVRRSCFGLENLLAGLFKKKRSEMRIRVCVDRVASSPCLSKRSPSDAYVDPWEGKYPSTSR